MNRVLIISFSFEQEPDALKVLQDAGFDATVLPMEKRQNWTESDLCDWMEKQDPAFTGLLIGADIALGETFLRRCPQIRALSLNCAGSDHLDLTAFRRHEVPVCNVPRQNFNAVADFAWGLILSLMRRIPQGDAAIRAGKWNQGVERSLAVSGKTIGIIGFGAIGQAVAKRAMGFDMRILVSSTSRNPETAARFGAEYVDRETLFSQSDIVIPTCPLAKETYHMINRDTLAIMKRDAVVVNPSRGGIIDTDALIEALRSHRIAGAALDVYETEPLYKSELFALENTVLTPHTAGLADREIRHVAVQSAENMVKMLSHLPVDTLL